MVPLKFNGTRIHNFYDLGNDMKDQTRIENSKDHCMIESDIFVEIVAVTEDGFQNTLY